MAFPFGAHVPWTERVVGEDPELELRPELEMLAVQVSRDDGVAARQLLHQALGHTAVLVDLDANDQAPPVQARDIGPGRGAVAARGEEGLGVRRRRVVAERGTQRLEAGHRVIGACRRWASLVARTVLGAGTRNQLRWVGSAKTVRSLALAQTRRRRVGSDYDALRIMEVQR